MLYFNGQGFDPPNAYCINIKDQVYLTHLVNKTAIIHVLNECTPNTKQRNVHLYEI